MEKISLVQVFKIIWKYKYFIFLPAIIVSFSIGLWTKKLPKFYSAEVTAIMPLSGSKGVSSLADNILSGSMLGSNSNSAKLIQALLESKRIRRDVIRRFDLLKVYNKKYEEDVLNILDRDIVVAFYVLKDIFRIKVNNMSDPVLAADIANFYIENTENLNNELGISVEKKLLMILDKAYPSIYPDGPFVKKNIISAFIITILFTFISTFIMEIILQGKVKETSYKL